MYKTKKAYARISLHKLFLLKFNKKPQKRGLIPFFIPKAASLTMGDMVARTFILTTNTYGFVLFAAVAPWTRRVCSFSWYYFFAPFKLVTPGQVVTSIAVFFKVYHFNHPFVPVLSPPRLPQWSCMKSMAVIEDNRA